MQIEVNKYIVKMYEFGNNTFSKASNRIKAKSEEEAIESVRQQEWWYDEGVGIDSYNLKYPLTFKADISND